MDTPEVPDRRRWLRALVWAGFVVGTIAAVCFVPAVREIVKGWSVESIRERLLAMGPWAWAFSTLLMILQAIVSPLPAFVITMANGYVFGWFWGGVLALLSATLAAQICYEASRALGRPALERWMGAGAIAWADGFFTRHGVWAVLVARLLPFVPFDPISYAAGLTSTTRLRFIAANLIGQIPATFVYSTLGSRLEDDRMPPAAVAALCSLAAVVLVAGAWRWARARRPKRDQ